MADIDDSRPPYRPPPSQRQDPSFTSFIASGLGCCCSFCTVLFGIVFLLMGSVGILYIPALGAGWVIIGVVCILAGCLSGKFTMAYARTAN